MTNEEFIEYSPLIRKWIEIRGAPMEYRMLPIKERCKVLKLITSINSNVNNLVNPIIKK